ncbi:hypothetical protein RND81_09G213000 [Saponaria officinalis]|uniref:Knottins-like domain-containing protein n=1 Tax=Saponaria officinalis TaxID=3572 RepID=A0AAW1INU8_SAPOF
MEKKSIVLFMLLLIFFASQGMVQKAEARVCQTQSHHYRGPCWRDHNCAMVCRTEGFSGGDCVGVARRCYCTRRC